MDSWAVTLAGFGLIVLGLALYARGPVGAPPAAGPVSITAAYFPASARFGILDMDCTDGEGRQVEASFGLTLCRGAALTRVRSEPIRQPGARIVAIAPDSQAAAAGLAVDDVIYRVASRRVSTGIAAARRMAALPSNETATVNFWRDGLPFLIRLRPGS